MQAGCPGHGQVIDAGRGRIGYFLIANGVGGVLCPRNIDQYAAACVRTSAKRRFHRNRCTLAEICVPYERGRSDGHLRAAVRNAADRHAGLHLTVAYVQRAAKMYASTGNRAIWVVLIRAIVGRMDLLLMMVVRMTC
jgi:hypothetical protein